MAINYDVGWFDPTTTGGSWTIQSNGTTVASGTIPVQGTTRPLNADAKIAQLVQMLSKCFVCGNTEQVFILCGVCVEAVKRSRIALVEEVLDTLRPQE